VKRLGVLLADDHPAFVQRVVNLLEQHYEIVGIVSDGQSLVTAALHLAPRVIVADISMPMLNGIEAVRRLRDAGSSAKVVFLTVHEDPDFVPECLEAGGLAYVVKSRLASDLIPAIRMVLTNHTYVSPTVSWERFR
jgi:DNA-binding NarL/FixJ family response regulator